MSLHTGQVTVRPVPSWDFGVRARLLLAFFGITAFAVLAAAVGIYAFRQVGERLDVVNTRVPPTITSLELSRSAERIIAAAPALLAATDRKRRDAVKSQLEAEVGILKSKLLALQQDGTAVLPLGRIEPVVTSLTGNLAALEEVVARRLDTNDRIRSLVRGVFQTNDATQRLLAPWLMVMESQISGLVDAARRGAARGGDGDAAGRLASLVLTQRPAQNAERAFSSAVDMLTEASTTDQERRLPVLSFQLGRAIRDLEATAAGMDPKLRPLFLEQVARLKDFVEGPNAIPAARRAGTRSRRRRRKTACGECGPHGAADLGGRRSLGRRQGRYRRGDTRCPVGAAVQHPRADRRRGAQPSDLDLDRVALCRPQHPSPPDGAERWDACHRQRQARCRIGAARKRRDRGDGARGGGLPAERHRAAGASRGARAGRRPPRGDGRGADARAEHFSRAADGHGGGSERHQSLRLYPATGSRRHRRNGGTPVRGRIRAGLQAPRRRPLPHGCGQQRRRRIRDGTQRSIRSLRPTAR